ncbi:hypothetical protein [Sanguibacter antarcticus]|uniref:Uncharacterized protein n=1 Tax=Sanguibacter antarcticus TaxID=372484 RepID=A0A2A9E2E7_9MICO|nr:hypothetical protein [Sanguibacter antarcticus]PFG32382.1 hypothetical protein ATL42_0209 [Sanguibacter antarcticus]
MHLKDLQGMAESCQNHGDGFGAFRTTSAILALGWPDDVTEQWLYDHPDHFIQDYGHIDLMHIGWTEEAIGLRQFLNMPTGASENDLLEYNAKNHAYLVGVRNAGVHIGVRKSWENDGTWKRSPLVIQRNLVEPAATGLQVVEGRTRVGVLQGRAAEGLFVAEQHLAWVGRLRCPT